MEPGFYETDRAVAEYLLFHYGSAELQMPWASGPQDCFHFPVRCVTETFLRALVPPGCRALDLGCAVGRSAFELSRFCGEVVAIDASQKFIRAAQELQAGGTLDYEVRVEGNLTERQIARIPEGTHPERIRFEVGDALQLREDCGTFDLLLAANLLDRVSDPTRLLRSFGRLVKPGGQLVLTSPYTWLEEFTPPSAWLTHGGQRASDALPSLLADFRLERRRDLPFVLREHARKFQWSVAEATTWRRRQPSER